MLLALCQKNMPPYVYIEILSFFPRVVPFYSQGPCGDLAASCFTFIHDKETSQILSTAGLVRLLAYSNVRYSRARTCCFNNIQIAMS